MDCLKYVLPFFGECHWNIHNPTYYYSKTQIDINITILMSKFFNDIHFQTVGYHTGWYGSYQYFKPPLQGAQASSMHIKIQGSSCLHEKGKLDRVESLDL